MLAGLLILCDFLSVPILLAISYVHHHRFEPASTFIDYELHPFKFSHSLFDSLVLSLFRACIVGVFLTAPGQPLTNLKRQKLPILTTITIFAAAVFSVVKCCVWKWHVAEPHGHQQTLRNAVVILECALGGMYLIALAQAIAAASKRVATTSGSKVVEDPFTHPLIDAVPDGESSASGSAKGKKAKKVNMASLKRIATLAAPERLLLLGGLVALMIASASQMVVPYMLGRLITVIGKDNSTAHDLNNVVLIMLVTFVISALATCWRGIAFTVAGERLVARLRRDLFRAVTSQEIGFFDGLKSGELVNRLAADTTVIQDIATVNVSMGLRWVAQAVIGIAVLFVISWHLTLVMMAAVPAVSAIAVVYGRYTRTISKAYQQSLADAGEVASEVLSNMKTVRSLYQGEVREHVRYSRAVNESYRYGRLRSYAYGGWSGIVMMFAYFAIVLCLWYGGHEVLRGHMEAGFLTSFLLYTIYIAFALGGIADLFTKLMTAVGASERMFELLDRKPRIPIAGGKTPDQAIGHVVFEEVEFSYPQRPDVSVLKKVSLECRPSEVVALVGRSGAGKSTIVGLIERFYDPNGGRILIDGVDTRSIDPEWLHQHVALVSQEPVLFACSIAENISYGARTCTREQIEEAARLANAHDFISSFPEGYNTLVGERGVQLSGGQKQRVAIARAIVANPRILLLDEATSALDAESEHLVQEAIEKLMVGRTVIIVAHRLSTVKNAARVLVLDGSGLIAQSGTHAELCQDTEGLYYQLVHRQLQV